MDDTLKAARAARRAQVFGIASGALIATYGLWVSKGHITHVGHAMGLNIGEANTLFIFIDFVAIFGKMLTSRHLRPKTRKIGWVFLAVGGALSLICNVASGILAGSFGAAVYGAFIVAIIAALEYAIANTMAKAEAVAMVAKAEADTDLAVAMAKAAADMAAAILATEQRLQAEMADLLAEAERATREAVVAEYKAQQQKSHEAAQAEAATRANLDRIAREKATADRLANLEAERAAMAAKLAEAAKAPAAKPLAKAVAKPVATGQASTTAMAILATNPDMATEDVVATAAAQGVEVSTRTVRRVKLEMRMATAAA